jgi:hypothetical protein
MTPALRARLNWKLDMSLRNVPLKAFLVVAWSTTTMSLHTIISELMALDEELYGSITLETSAIATTRTSTRKGHPGVL